MNRQRADTAAAVCCCIPLSFFVFFYYSGMDGCLVGPAVFKTVVRRKTPRVGSIPTHSRHYLFFLKAGGF